MEEKEFNYINAIPLVDVMLVLLTIALTTATFVSQGAIKVNLPTSSIKSDKEPVVVPVYITNDRRLFINKTEVSEANFKTEIAQQNKDSVIEINADKTLMIEEVTRILGYVQESGFSKISIKTEKSAS